MSGLPSLDPGLVRAMCLFVPTGAVLGLVVWRRPDVRTATGAFLASVWCFVALAALHGASRYFDWWHYQAEGGLFLGMPVDLLLGWSLLWGAIPLLTAPRAPLVLVAAALLWLDLLTVPLLGPLVTLREDWLIGETAALAVCVIPAQFLGRWTREDRCLPGRAALQMVCFGGLMLWLLPTFTLERTGGSWKPLLDLPRWQLSLIAQLLLAPAILGVSALQEFVQRGGGTPIPLDPPKRLVTSGPYAYVTNPMQLSILLLFAGVALVLRSPWVGAAAFMAWAFGAGLAAWDERRDMPARFGSAWQEYHRAVRAWVPRWRPWRPGSLPPARLYVAAGCDICSQLGAWIRRRHPSALEILPAEDYPDRTLFRLTYDARDGSPHEDGIAAMARAMEHIHLGWAVVGGTMRAPVVRQFLQLLGDAVGGEPRPAVRRGPASVEADQ